MIQYLDTPWLNCENSGYSGEGWYFWDETQVYCYGPYTDEEITESELKEYFKWLNSKNPNKEIV